MGVGEWIGVVSGLVTVVGALIIGIMQARAKIQTDQSEKQISEHEKIIKLQQDQMARQELVMKEQQSAIDRFHEAHAGCREEVADLYGWLRVFRDGQIRSNAEIKRLGGESLDVPDLPPRRPVKMDTAGGEFLHRTTLQNKELVQDIGKSVPLPEGEGP